MAATPPKPARAKMLDPDEWGGELIDEKVMFKHPLKFVVLSLSTGTDCCSTREECSRIAKELQDRDLNDLGLYNIRYNFLLGGDGNIYVGRGWLCKPAITGIYSMIHGKYLHVACIGNYKGKVRPPAMYKAQWDLLQNGVDQKYLTSDFVFI